MLLREKKYELKHNRSFYDEVFKFTSLAALPVAIIAVFSAELSSFALFTALFCISLCDICTMKIPNVFLIILLTCGLPSFYELNSRFSMNFLFAAFIILSGSIANRKKPFLGGADIKIMALLSILAGAAECLYVYIIANLFAVIPAVAAIIVTKIKKAREPCEKIQVPFVPFITIGYLVLCLR